MRRVSEALDQLAKRVGFRIIPDRGTWLETQFDQHDLLNVYLDRRHRRRKFLVTTFLRTLGYSKDEDVLKLFYQIEDLKRRFPPQG